jgi:hypothetical protein
MGHLTITQMDEEKFEFFLKHRIIPPPYILFVQTAFSGLWPVGGWPVDYKNNIANCGTSLQDFTLG